MAAAAPYGLFYGKGELGRSPSAGCQPAWASLGDDGEPFPNENGRSAPAPRVRASMGNVSPS